MTTSSSVAEKITTIPKHIKKDITTAVTDRVTN